MSPGAWPGGLPCPGPGVGDTALLTERSLRHTFATWLEDSGVPARVIDELMGHHGGRRRDGDGSPIGLRYRHMTAELQAHVLAVIGRCLAAAQAVHAPAMPQGGGEDIEGQGK